MLLVIALLLFFTVNSLAYSGTIRRDYAIGWQFSRPASGFSLKIPYLDDYYIQPIIAVVMNQNDTITNGHYALGIRGVYNLDAHQDFLPYAGAGLGYSESFRKGDDSFSNGNIAYEAFFGVEYRKYLIRPSLEIGLGGLNKYDGSFHAGVICNLAVLYYF